MGGGRPDRPRLGLGVVVVRTVVVADAVAGAGPGVHPLAQLLAHFEEGEPLRADANRLARPRVTPLIFLVSAARETSEAANLDPLAAAEGVDHRVEHLADQKLGAAMRQLGALGDEIDEIRLGHWPGASTVPGKSRGSQRLQ